MAHQTEPAGRIRTTSSPRPPLLLLYDGACGRCLASVAWLEAHDHHGAIRFEPLQGPAAAPWRLAAGPGPDTLVAVRRGPDGERVFTRSVATLIALRALGGGWAVAARLLSLVPRPLADAAYRWVARRRHRVAVRGPGPPRPRATSGSARPRPGDPGERPGGPQG